MRLRTKMAVAMLMAATLPLLVAMAVSLLHSAEQVQVLTEESALGNVQAGAERLSSYFAARIAEISTYANTPLIKKMSWPEIQPFLQAELERHGGLYEKLVLGLPGDGHYYKTNAGNPAYGGLCSFDDSDPLAKLKSLRRREYWRRVVGENRGGHRITYVSDPVISYTTGVRQVLVASTVLSDNGDVLGFVGGALTWSEIDTAIRRVRENILKDFGHSAELCLVSRRGVYMYHWDPKRSIHLERDQDGTFVLNDIGEKVAKRVRITDEEDPDLASAGRRMIQGDSGTAYYIDKETGRGMVMVYAPVRSADYSLGMVVPRSEVMAPVAGLTRWLTAVTIASIALVISISWYLAKKVSGPITALSVAARKIAGGDRRTTLIPKGHDEVAELTHTFNDMTDSLRAREEALGEGERRLQAILDSVHTGVLVVDAETKRVVETNPASLQMLRSSRDEVVGRPCSDYLSVDECAYGSGFPEDCDEESVESELTTADGVSLPVLRTITRTVLNGRECLLESLVDISDLKRIEDELHRRIMEETEAKRRLEVLVSDASGRERRMVELKREVNDLLVAKGEAAKYDAPRQVAEMEAAFAAEKSG